MKLAIICFARQGSTRFPEKNMAILHGKPLIEYTLEAMKDLHALTEIPCHVLTDFEDIVGLCLDYRVNMIWRDHPKEWDDIRLNEWAHEKIRADAYILLQPTSPIRDVYKIVNWINICLESNVKSAFSVYKNDRKNYVMNGGFFYYRKDQIVTGFLNDENSLLFIDKYNVDIDYKKQLDKLNMEGNYEHKNNFRIGI